MLIDREIKILHLEPTDVCQAACPMCARETDATFQKNKHHHLSMDQILKILPLDKIKLLDKMYMCGVYGDPAAGQNTLELYQTFRDISPKITLGMNTNGGLQNREWWKKLAKILNKPKDYVVFSIDGLEDTNHIYRKNVSWKKLLENAQTFIQYGGSAHWDMLAFKHNEHQISHCEQLAKDLGFKWFRVKVSKRKMVDGLLAPVTWQLPKISPGDISCAALNEQSMYIDSQGNSYPCCWLNRQPYQNIPFKQIQDTWQSSTPIDICQRTCGQQNNLSKFSSQWRKEIEFNV